MYITLSTMSGKEENNTVEKYNPIVRNARTVTK
jgi:hypothetical protein